MVGWWGGGRGAFGDTSAAREGPLSGVARGYVVPQPVRHRCNACACRMRTARDSPCCSALLYVGVRCVRGRGLVSCVRTVALARRPPSALAAHAGRGAVARDLAGRGGCRGTRPCETAATARDGVMRCWENPFATGSQTDGASHPHCQWAPLHRSVYCRCEWVSVFVRSRRSFGLTFASWTFVEYSTEYTVRDRPIVSNL